MLGIQVYKPDSAPRGLVTPKADRYIIASRYRRNTYILALHGTAMNLSSLLSIQCDGFFLILIEVKYQAEIRFDRFEGVVGVRLKDSGAALRFRLLVVFAISPPKRGVLMPELLSRVVASVRLSAGV